MSTGNNYSGDGEIMQEAGGSTGGLAPSERHLEDWIWTHPEALGMIGIPEPGEDGPIYDFKFRQVNLPSGIPDLVGVAWATTFVVCEIKKGPVTAQSFSQLMRYMRDVKALFRFAESDLVGTGRVDPDELAEYKSMLGDPDALLLRGLLIGSRVEHPNLLAACRACDIDVITYQYQGGKYSFFDVNTWGPNPQAVIGAQVDLMDSPLGETVTRLVYDAIQHNVTEQRRLHFSAVRAAEAHIDALDSGEVES